MKKILYITQFIPKDNASQAGVNCTFNLIKLIKETYKCNIDILGTINDAELSDGIDDIKQYTENQYFYKINSKIKALNIIRNFLVPLLVSVRYDLRVKRKLKELAKSNNYDYIFVDYTQSSLYIKCIKKYFSKAKTVLIEQDVSFLGYKRKYDNCKSIIKKIGYFIEYSRLKKYELKIIDKFSYVCTLNEKDAKLLNANRKINILAPFVKNWGTVSKEHEGINIMFWGAMNRKENEDAVFYFTEKIWPKIYRENVKFYIIGSNPSEKIKKLSNDSIIVTGFVKNPNEYFEKMDISVVPLRLGAGIKIKVLESLANGIPVITTSIGSEGIDYTNELIVRDLPDEFLESLNYLIDNNKERVELIKRGKVLIENNYGYNKNKKVLDIIFNEKEI